MVGRGERGEEESFLKEGKLDQNNFVIGEDLIIYNREL